jgi:hypothetical protein
MQWEQVNFMGAGSGTTGGTKEPRVLLNIYGKKSEIHSVLALPVADAKMLKTELEKVLSQIEDEDSSVPV